MPLTKIISGGQTGVDRGALDAALDERFPCGGWCPTGRLAEDGPIDPVYPMSEMDSGGYAERTRRNVVESDGTAVIYFGDLGGGTEETVRQCLLQRKPYKLIDATEISAPRAAELIMRFVDARAIGILNVAGSRQSELRTAHAYAYEVVRLLLQRFTREAR